jgi:hypothetical protein
MLADPDKHLFMRGHSKYPKCKNRVPTEKPRTLSVCIGYYIREPIYRLTLKHVNARYSYVDNECFLYSI